MYFEEQKENEQKAFIDHQIALCFENIQKLKSALTYHKLSLEHLP